jgi:hypothetical protein
MKPFFFTCLCLLLSSCSSVQTTMPDYVLRSVRFDIAKADSTAKLAVDIRDAAIRDSLIVDTYFKRKLPSPFTRSSFYLFSCGAWLPTSYIVFAVHDSLLLEIPHDRQTKSFNTKRLVKSLNSLLLDEPPFNGGRLFELASFVIMLTDPGYEFNRILTSANDIELGPYQPPLPEAIKLMISPPQLSLTGDAVILFVWDQGSTELRKITMTFHDSEISLDVDLLGCYGLHHAIL